MKKTLLLTLLLLVIAGCNPQPALKKSSDSPVTIDEEGGGGGGSGGGGQPPSGNGSTCHGNENDGAGPGYPIFHFNLLLSGGVSWVPNNYANSMAYESNLNLEEGSIFFRSDSRLRVRFKTEAQPNPPTGQKYCYNRSTGMAADPADYTKLKFTLYLRDVLCNSVQTYPPDPVTGETPPPTCNSYSLGSRYRTRIVGPVNVGSCSEVIDLGHLRNSSDWGTVVEVAYVKSDSTCQYNGTHCPAEDDVRSASCWNMTMQVVTDHTQNFK